MAQAPETQAAVISPEDIVNIKNEFSTFLETLHRGDGNLVYVPEIQAIAAESAPNRTLVVDWDDLRFAELVVNDPQLLFTVIRNHYFLLFPHLTQVVRDLVNKAMKENMIDAAHRNTIVHLAFKNLPAIGGIREFDTRLMGRLVSFECTVTRSSGVRPAIEVASFQCMECNCIIPEQRQEFKFEHPRVCPGTWDPNLGRFQKCTNRSAFRLLPEQCTYLDWQKLRVQEEANKVPEGSMPRAMDIIVLGDQVERAHPGDRIRFTGCLIVAPDVGAYYKPQDLPRNIARERNKRLQGDTGADGVSGLASLGVRTLSHRLMFAACHVDRATSSANGVLTLSPGTDVVQVPPGLISAPSQVAQVPAELTDGRDEMGNVYMSLQSYQTIDQFKQEPDFIGRMASIIAPHIYGYDQVKKGILLMLLGGVPKTTQNDSIRLRGDINVCIVGDPATAKSQLLKYVNTITPRAVYASGKTSSAAGLTASVHRDRETGDFIIEAGALMLADNGVCCIDGFDKMDPKDMVAIHEAMEQQTISIAKAGIQATLHARASILAACSPAFGRYDPGRALNQNVNLTPPIMSRFDLFFVLVDEQNPTEDAELAKHTIHTHVTAKPTRYRQTSNDSDGLLNSVDGGHSELEDRRLLADYINLARSFSPWMPKEVRRSLVQRYVTLRKADTGGNKMAYRITVRQLESLIRLSEAMAKARLSQEVTRSDVDQAFDLLRNSILHIKQRDLEMDSDDVLDATAQPEVDQADATTTAAGADATAAAVSAQAKRQASRITFEEYDRMARRLALYLEIQEVEGVEVTIDELVIWYVEEYIAEVEGGTGAVDSQKVLLFEEKVARVVKRLIERDRILIVVREDPEHPGNHVVTKHPNYVVAA